MEQLFKLLHSIRSDIDFENETVLIDKGFIKFLEVLTLFVEIQKEFDVKLPVSKIKPENFNSAEAMWRMIQEASGPV